MLILLISEGWLVHTVLQTLRLCNTEVSGNFLIRHPLKELFYFRY